MNPEVLGIGEVVLDWVTEIDHFPEPDEKIDSLSQSRFSGGVTANYSVAVSRLGAKTAFFGAIGQDEYGQFLLKDFEKEGIDCTHLIQKKDMPTPANFIMVVKGSGEKIIIQSPFMHTTVPSQADFNFELPKSLKILHSSGIYGEITAKAFAAAREQGITTSLDLEKQIAVRGYAALHPILKKTDILIPNKMGAMQLTGTSTPLESARTLIKWGVKTIIITLGIEGAMLVTDKGYATIPAFQVPMVDTTGAGDTFCAAFGFAKVLRGFDNEDSCTFANAAAAIKIQKLGARTGMPTSDQVKDFLKERKNPIADLF